MPVAVKPGYRLVSQSSQNLNKMGHTLFGLAQKRTKHEDLAQLIDHHSR